MPPMRVARSSAVAVSAVAALLLVGCCRSESPQRRTVTGQSTPAAAVESTYAFYEETVKSLGEAGWQSRSSDGNVDGQIPEGCRLTDGSPGVKYTILLGGPGQASPLEAARRVQSIWSAMGYKAEVKVRENPHDRRGRQRCDRRGIHGGRRARIDDTHHDLCCRRRKAPPRESRAEPIRKPASSLGVMHASHSRCSRVHRSRRQCALPCQLRSRRIGVTARRDK